VVPIERDHPRAHLVVDDFFAPGALRTVMADLPSLDGHMKPGLVREIGHDGQSVFFEHRRRRNRAVWVHDPSRILRLFREQLWAPSLLEAFDAAREPLFQIIGSCWAPHLQVSRYMTGDHYDFHEDEGAGVNLTAIVFLAADPPKVRGGDLVLAYRGEDVTVRFRHNRLVIFPSRTLHRVTRVRVDSDDVRDARVSLQCWLAHGGQSRRVRRREPVADRPTFLLAEEPIVAAAQQVVDGPAARRDQTPEELYWGAFYPSRILPANLRCLLAAQAEEAIASKAGTARVRIRRRGALEVYTSTQIDGGPARIGFELRGPEVSPSGALSLFVETGRGKARMTRKKTVPPGASERQAGRLLAQLLAQIRT